ncbi:MAG TPA: lysophospholipid acyltransferase family protein [Alphaproteobacteria bacterium]|nr:lysophospholipid acyltransferase family protein [Alphaproteobacteria bacterium]
MILIVRSAAFNVAFFAMTIAALLTTWPVLFSRRPQGALWVARNWARLTFLMLRVLVGIGVEIRGDVTRLAGPVIIASNHQSAWDTMVFLWLCRLPTYAMKKELMAIPFFGWMAKRQGHIAVDRKAGAAAFRRLQRQASAALAAGRQIVLFPEGTRVAPDVRRPYQPGIAGLYAALRAPVVPVAVNSGLFWGRRSFIKRPGTIVLEILPEIPAGLARDEFLAELEQRISSAAGRLIAEARKADPRL